MASITKNKSDNWSVRFRFPVNGTMHRFNRALKTKDEKTALRKMALIEETIHMIETGRIEIPAGSTEKQVATFILSGGKLTEKPQAIKSIRLEDFWQEYESGYSLNKEPNSVKTERTHKNNLVKILGNISIQSITTDKLQIYVNKRLKQKGIRGNTVQPKTVHKEIQTMNYFWRIATTKKYVATPSPTIGVIIPKIEDVKPFRTWEQIESIVERNGLDSVEAQNEWDSLFLRENEIEELLKFVKDKTKDKFYIYAAFAFAAYTGARRSEIIRSEIDDFNFENGSITLRQKKKDRSLSMSYREVALHPKLKGIMKEYFDQHHVGGKFTIAIPPDSDFVNQINTASNPQSITPHQMRHCFERLLENSKWEVLRGWHVLRHSFASNCARQNIREHIIDSWMGHASDSKIRLRYRHLFPEDTQDAINQLFKS